jgi:hypothetical protein
MFSAIANSRKCGKVDLFSLPLKTSYSSFAFVENVFWEVKALRNYSFSKNLSRTFLEVAAAFVLLSRSFLRWFPLGICRFSFDKAKQ